MTVSWTSLNTFTRTRPMMYGAPTAAALGLILGLAFRVGPQLAEPSTMEPMDRASIEDTATPVSWPSGKVPDYVIGTDFLASTRPQQPVVASYRYPDEEPFVMPPPMDVPPPLVTAARAARTQTAWASTEGDILNVRLPEDTPEGPPALDCLAFPRASQA